MSRGTLVCPSSGHNPGQEKGDMNGPASEAAGFHAAGSDVLDYSNMKAKSSHHFASAQTCDA